MNANNQTERTRGLQQETGTRSIPADAASGGPTGGGFWLAVVTVGIIAAAAHLPSLRNGFTNWDDTPYISNNLQMRNVEGLKRIWLTTESPQYYPLTFTSFWVEYQLWHDRPLGFHAVNVALHAINAMLVLGLLRMLGMSVGAAFAVALLFAISPIQVMSVAWIAQRKNTLSTVFGLLAMMCAARFFQRDRLVWYLATVAMFAAALLAKATWAVLPLIVLATAVWLQRVPLRRVILPIIPLVAMSVLSVVITTAMERQYSDPDDLSLAQRVPIAPGALLWYYGKSLLPIGLAPFYPTWPATTNDWQAWLPILLTLGSAAALFMARRRIPPWVLWGITCFAIFLAPIIGIASFGNIGLTWVSDHYVYYAVVALYASLVAAIGALLPTKSTRVRAITGAALLLPTAGAMAIGTLQYTPVFRDAHAFWQRTIEANPNMDVAYHGRAYAYIATKEYEKAIADLKRAAELNPKRFQTRVDLGWIYNQIGQYDKAIQVLRDVLKDDPKNGKAMVHLAGALLADAQDPSEAEQLYQAALKDDPGYDEAATNLAVMYAQMQRLDDAERVIHDALAVNSTSGMLWRAMGQHYDRVNKLTDAENAFRRAVNLDPSDADARFGLGVARFRQGRYDEAIAQYERAIAISPSTARYWNNLGCAHLDAGRPEKAAEKIRRAVELDPLDAPAWNNLGAALDRLSRREEALAAYEKAVEVAPGYWRAAQRIVAALTGLGRYQDAVQRLNLFISNNPPPDARLGLSLQMALLSAAAPDDTVRRPDFALKLAQAMQQSQPTEAADVLDVLSIAQAANGDFTSATTNARRASDLFDKAGRTTDANAARERTALFEQKKPYQLRPGK